MSFAGAGWQRVVFSDDTDEDGNCPVCGVDYSYCPCPGPTQDGWEYKTVRGIMYAKQAPIGKQNEPDLSL